MTNESLNECSKAFDAYFTALGEERANKSIRVLGLRGLLSCVWEVAWNTRKSQEDATPEPDIREYAERLEAAINDLPDDLRLPMPPLPTESPVKPLRAALMCIASLDDGDDVWFAKKVAKQALGDQSEIPEVTTK